MAAETAERSGREHGGVPGARVVGEWRDFAAAVRRQGAVGFARTAKDEIAENNLLTYASAISFQIVFALVPAMLALVAVLGFLGLQEVWQDDVAPVIRDHVSRSAFDVIESTVRRILTTKQQFWLTLGAAIAIWEVSGAVRATAGALNEVFDIREDRSFVRRFLTSFVLAVVASVGIVLAAAAIQVGPRAARWAVSLPRGAAVPLSWAVAFALLLAVVAAVVQFAPARRRATGWVGLVSVVVVAAWLVASAVFTLWVRKLASYGSIYGSLAAVILLLTYVYVSTVVFLAAVQLDALVRRAGQRRESS